MSENGGTTKKPGDALLGFGIVLVLVGVGFWIMGGPGIGLLPLGVGVAAVLASFLWRKFS